MDEQETAAVVEGDVSASVAETARKPRPRGAPKWEIEARDRLKVAIRRYSKPLADLVARDANEGDTRLLVTSIRTLAGLAAWMGNKAGPARLTGQPCRSR